MAVQFVMQIAFFLLLTYGLVEEAPASSPAIAQPNCTDKCGNVKIPYPFGIGPNCYMANWFEIVCNKTNFAAKAFLPSIGMEVMEINISDPYGTNTYSYYEPGLIRVKMPIISSSSCINQSSDGVDFSGTPYFFSSYRNKFISVGCDNLATMTGLDPMVVVGCKTDCNNQKLKDKQGTCSGFNCCQTTVPYGIQVLNVTFVNTHSCKHAFLAETQWLNKTDLSNGFLYLDYVPVVLEWTASYFTAFDFNEIRARHLDWDYTSYGAKYFYCLYGYEGNPYLLPGCQGKLQLPTPLIFLYAYI